MFQNYSRNTGPCHMLILLLWLTLLLSPLFPHPYPITMASLSFLFITLTMCKVFSAQNNVFPVIHLTQYQSPNLYSNMILEWAIFTTLPQQPDMMDPLTQFHFCPPSYLSVCNILYNLLSYDIHWLFLPCSGWECKIYKGKTFGYFYCIFFL